MQNEFSQITWDDAVRDELRQIVRLAVREDLGSGGASGDCTSRALVPEGLAGRAAVAARQPGVIAGLLAAEEALLVVDPRLQWAAEIADGRSIEPGDEVARIEGPARSLLAAERLILNLLGRLSGIATLARKYVDAVAGTQARIYDTRKTTPGWRRLEKYAVRCGGGWNHRTGLFDAVLIKDNHLALGRAAQAEGRVGYTPAEAVQKARRLLQSERQPTAAKPTIVEVEVDTLAGLEEVLPAGPDLVLLDNMSPDALRRAVAIRDAGAPEVRLEASGGVNLSTVAAVAASGVDRISVGALTHSACWLDVGLDWRS